MHKSFLLLLFTITLIGFYFRYVGIASNYSFWTDESNVTLYSRSIIDSGLPVLANGYTTGIYQVALHYLVALFFFILGISEFSARLPFVLFGSLSVFLAGIITRKITNSTISGLYVAGLIGFLQIQLSYSTQVRPYIMIEFLSFILFYLMVSYKKVYGVKYLIYGTIVGIIGVLFHLSASLLLIAWGMFVASLYLPKKKDLSVKKLGMLVGGVGLLFIAVVGFIQLFSIVKISYFDFLNPKNNISHLNLFFLKTYWFLSLPAILGLWYLLRKNLGIVLFFLAWAGPLIFLWTFYSVVHNIRYLVPVVGWLVILSAVGIHAVFEKWKLPTILYGAIFIVLVFITNNKILIMPKDYYTPNNDFYGDVQNADYKSVFAELDQMYGEQLQTMAIFDSWNDRSLWYLKRPPSALFLQKEMIMSDGRTDPMTNAEIFTNVEQFKQAQSKYEQGIVFIEEWQSPMSDEIEQYVIVNLKFEFRKDGFSSDPKDRWPVSVYSWGL
jgi:hypothetical protein